MTGVVVRGCSCGCSWLFVVVRGCSWLFVVVRGCSWLYVVVRGFFVRRISCQKMHFHPQVVVRDCS